jgi:hypothetical protein
MAIPQSYIDELKRLVPQVEDELAPGVIEERLGDAVRFYSRISPMVNGVKDYAGDGSTYEFDLPADWDAQFSRVARIEYPQGEQQPEYLGTDEWIIYDTPSSQKLRFTKTTPASGETARVSYTRMHKISSQQNTVPEGDNRALCYLAASLIARNMEMKYASHTEPMLEADVINYRTKQRQYADVADHYEALYKAHFGMRARDISPAAAGWGPVDFDFTTRKGIEPP